MEETINCTMSIDEDSQNIKIANLAEEDIILNYSNDINFTNLVSLLTDKIDISKEIILTFNEEVNDEKTQLIINTITDIFNIYNESIKEEAIPE